MQYFLCMKSSPGKEKKNLETTMGHICIVTLPKAVASFLE